MNFFFGSDKKRQKQSFSPKSSSSSENSPIKMEQQVLSELKKLNAKVDNGNKDVLASINSVRADVSKLEEMIKVRDDKIAALEDRITALESKISGVTADVHHLEYNANRFKIRIYNFPRLESSYHDVRTRVFNFIQNIMQIDVRQIADFSIINVPKGKQIIVSFLSVETVDFLFLNSKRIFQQHGIRIARELSRTQRKSMQEAIDQAKNGNSKRKVTVDWAAPAAYVDGNRVWPATKAARRPSVSYSTATKSKMLAVEPFSAIDPSTLSSIPPNTQLHASIEPVRGSQFLGVLLSWNDSIPVKDVISSVTDSANFPFRMEARDNIIYAAAALEKGKISTYFDDGGEKDAGLNLLGAIEESKKVNLILIVFRKLGDFQLGPERYRLFNGLARDLLAKLDE